LVVGLVIAALSFFASRSTIKPLNKMTQTIEKMARNPSRGQRLIAAGSIETRQLANAFNQLMTERDVISKMKEEFVSNVSHELRTPLTSINGALRLLASGAAGELPQKAEEMANLALRNGDRLRLLISDLLDFGKLAAGRMSINLSAQPILPIIKTAIESNASLAHERGLSLEIEGNENPVVLTDAHRLRQVLDNFISNAIKFSPPDLAISIRTTQSRPGYTSIIVHDRGTGVPEHFEPKLFERFSQANSGSAKSVTGTGLGLAICRELATLMNGQTGYFYDQGANFWIELPNVVSRKTSTDEST
jgi:signal transduction histidine kinase